MDATISAAELSGAPHPGRRVLVAAMLISTFMAAAEVTIISTAMPTIVARLGGFALFSWAFGIYLLGQAVMTPIYGRMADLYGRRVVYLGSTGLFLVGSLLCGFAWSMPALIVFRAIQGLGGGGLVPLATIIISDVSSAEDRPRVLGYVSGVWGVAAIVGPLIGSLCVGTLGWPLVFWINIPVGLVTTALVARHLRDPARRAHAGGVDLAGAGLLAGGIVAGMAALIQWDTLPAGWLAGLCLASAGLLGGFGLRERGSPEPLFNGALLRRPVIVAANASGLLCGALLIAFTAFLPAWVQGTMGRSAMAAGFVLGLMTVSWTICSMGLGRALVRLPLRTTALGGAVAVAAGSAGLLAISGSGWTVLLLSSAALGAGLGTCSLVFTVAVQASVAWGERGGATSLFYFCRLVGQAVGAAVFGGVLNAGLAGGAPGTHDALRDLMDPVSRAALPADALVRLVPVLSAALHGVFFASLIVAILTIPVALLAPGRGQVEPSAT